MEPTYILDEFVGADQATIRCGDPSPEVRSRFDSNLAAVVRRAQKALDEETPDDVDTPTDELIAARVAARRDEINGLVDSLGCASPEVVALVRLFGMRASLNIH